MSLRKILLTAFLFLGLSLSSGYSETLTLEQQAELANIPIYHFFGEKWITLPDFAFLLKGSLKQDSVSRRTEITFPNHRLVFLPGSKKALYDGEIKEMSRPARLIAGGVEAIPLAFASLVVSPAFIPPPQTQPSPPPLPSFQPASTVPEKPPATEAPTVTEIIAQPAIAPQGKDIVLIIDPGHGYQDSGAVGPWGLKEKDVNLDLALRLTDYLKRGRPKVKVVLTRKDDTFLSLEERTRLANQSGADLFVSIHTNSSRWNRDSASGVETYYPARKPTFFASANNSGDEIADILKQSGGQDVIQRCQYLAALIQDKLADIFKKDIVPDRGIKGRGFYVLKYTNMVSVLVEVGFICNQNIEANLRLPEVRQAIAVAIGRGIESYLDGQPLKSTITVDTGVIEEPVNE